ncbi:amidophosphoribosyltransferase [bacterium]|nr:MAG: amidophosphoribosyltransferase [bacterium]
MLKEGCGVIGIWGESEASRLAYFGLYALQHRGQEGCGIVTADGSKLHIVKGKGLVSDVFHNDKIFGKLPGNAAIGHNRYSTTGEKSYGNVQPLLIRFRGGEIACVHNGNLVNSAPLRRHLIDTGSVLRGDSDTEPIMHLVARSKKPTVPEMVEDALSQVQGAYSVIFITPDYLIAARDPYGFRPLEMGKLGDGYIIARESCAFDIVGAEYIREIKPGEILVIDKDGNTNSCFPFEKKREAFCIFELIYFSRPDSRIFDVNVDKVRRDLGRRLAVESPVDADMVISVPDSSNSAALGYAQEAGIPFEIGFIRNHYIGRTFINPGQLERDIDAKIKYNPVKGVIKKKRVVIVDDSIVRGTTISKLVRMIKSAGAKEVHLRISSPPIRFPCFYGVDTPTKEELIASYKSAEEIRKLTGADSLKYLSLEGMLSLSALPEHSWCTACFDGKYPVL